MEHNAIVNPRIEDYCTLMSTPPSTYCEAIYHHTMKTRGDSQMLIGPLQAGFLGFLIAATGARRVLEIGCFTGYSALAMAERLPEDGEVITIDYDEKVAVVAREFWTKSPHGGRISLIVGTALEVLKGLRGPFDFVFIDADKENYIAYLEMVLPMLSEQGIIIADNSLWYGRVVDADTADPDALAMRAFNEYIRQRDDLESILLPVRDGITLIRLLK
ncbi:MAG: class I SAM-dependent methyltransferase [Spirochaetes bacterium]|nr:class I SAM-dependent methyltransferase [Spirochaetota bacterium]